MTPVGAGYAGYTGLEMNACLVRAMKRSGGKPDNLVIPDGLYEAVQNRNT